MVSHEALNMGSRLDEDHAPETNGRMAVCRRCGAQTDSSEGRQHIPDERNCLAPTNGWTRRHELGTLTAQGIYSGAEPFGLVGVLGRSSVRLAEARKAELDMVDRSHVVGDMVLRISSSERGWPGPTDTLGSLRRTPYVSEAVQLDAEHSRCRPYVPGRNRVSKHHVNKLRGQAWYDASEQSGQRHGCPAYSDRLGVEQAPNSSAVTVSGPASSNVPVGASGSRAACNIVSTTSSRYSGASCWVPLPSSVTLPDFATNADAVGPGSSGGP